MHVELSNPILIRLSFLSLRFKSENFKMILQKKVRNSFIKTSTSEAVNSP